MSRGRSTSRPSNALAPARGAEQGPITRLSFDAQVKSISAFAYWAEDGELDLTPPYQRGSVWPEEARVALVHSVLQGVPLGSVFLNARGEHDPVLHVVDGKQRLEALTDFLAGRLRFPAAWIAPEDLAGPADADGLICFSDLTRPAQLVLKRGATVSVYMTKLPSEEEERELFERINWSGVPMEDSMRPSSQADPGS